MSPETEPFLDKSNQNNIHLIDHGFASGLNLILLAMIILIPNSTNLTALFFWRQFIVYLPQT